MRSGRRFISRYTLFFLIALVLGGTFRFYRLDWGRPNIFHPDEARVSYAVGDIDRQVAGVREKITHGERVSVKERIEAYNPHFFAYGSLPIYLIRTTQKLLSGAGGAATRILHAVGLKKVSLSPPDLFVVGRGLSAFFDTLTILMVFLIGSRLFSKRAGALASLFFAFTVFHIQLAHFITVDVTLACFVALAIYFCARIAEGGRFRYYALAGIFAGLAIATKFSAVPIVLPLLFAHCVCCGREKRLLSPRQWAKLLIALAASGAVFLICEPFFLLDHKEFMRQILEQREMVQGRWAPPWTYQYEHTIRGLYQLKNLVVYCMGAPLGVAIMIGTVYLLGTMWRKPYWAVILLLAWLIPVGAATASFKVKFIRYFAPVIPFLCIMGAQGICALYERARDRGVGMLVRVAAGAVVGFALFYSLAYMNIYRHDDTRLQASDWLYEHAPKGSHILAETWEFSVVPVGTARSNAGAMKFSTAQLESYKPDDRSKARYLATEIAKADVIALTTKRMYGSIMRVPERYPITSNYYRLLFQERLGYKLVKSVTSHPRLFGVSFNDDFSDESFTVYDHPKVLLFQKVTPYPVEYLQHLITAEPKIDYWPVLYDALGADEFNRPERSAASMTPSLGGYAPREYGGARAVIVWLLMIEIMGLIALPLTGSFLGNLRDRGYPFAKAVAVSLSGYIVWLAACLGTAPFSRGLILAALGIVALLSCLFSTGGHGLALFFREKKRMAVASELVFLGSFALFLLFRLYNPDIFWSESSMDYSFINSILRSRSFPPIDPWASGIYLNYYYYGHYLVAMLTKLSGIPSHISYNLAFCLIPALVISGVYSIVYTLTGRVRYGVLGGLFAGVLGNIDGFFLLIDECPWREAFYRFLHITMPTHAEPVFRFFRCAHEVIPHSVHEFPLWSFIFVDLHAHVIAMPFAIVLLAFALNSIRSPRGTRSPFGGGARGIGHFFVTAIVLGMMVPMNTWDFPTYLALFGLIFFAREIVAGRGGLVRLPISEYSIWWGCSTGGRVLCFALSCIRLEGPVGGLIRRVARVAGLLALLTCTALIAYSPFFQFFGREGMGIGTVGALTTSLGSILRFSGFFLFLIASYLYMETLLFVNGSRGCVGRLLVVLALLAAAVAPWAVFTVLGTRDYATLSLALALALLGMIALRGKRDDTAALFSVLLVAYGLLIISFCEVFHIRDFLQGGEYKRMNTIFKFYMPVWFFFSISGAFFISRILIHPPYALSGIRGSLSALKRGVWWILFLVLFAAALVFTFMGPRARTIGDDNYGRNSLFPPGGPLQALFPRILSNPTLNGLAYMKTGMPDEYDAIFWLNEKVQGQPTITEATEGDYLYQYARISSNTGIPAVLGWWSHVDQRGYAYRDIRKTDILKFYKSADPLEMSTIIAKYDIRYVYVGDTERKVFTPERIDNFNNLAQLFKPVFNNKVVNVYQTQYFAPVTKEETTPGEVMGPQPMAKPIVVSRVRMLEGSEGVGPGEYSEPRGIALDNQGNVYVADFRNYRIQKFDAKGFFVKAWGEQGDYPGQFNDPCGVATNKEGKVYVADTFNSRIQIFDGEGKFLSQFAAGFFAPRGIAIDGKGRIWVADTGNGVVKVFSGNGEQLKVIGKRGSGKGEFDNPNSIAIDQKGNVYVADAANKRVQILDRDGGFLSEFPVEGWEKQVFSEPYLDIDDRGDIYLTDPPGKRILKYSKEGKLLGTLKPMEGSQTVLEFPMGIAVEKKGEAIYVVDCRHHRIRKFSKQDFR